MREPIRNLWARAMAVMVAALWGLMVAGCGDSRKTEGDPAEREMAEKRDVWRQEVRNLLGDRRALVAWSTNRWGNHEIALLELPDGEVRRLTTHEHPDYFPRFSPDGKRLVFARAQRRDISQRESRPWDVYLLNIEGGGESLVSRNGNTPTWSDDGRKVYFQRNGGEVVEHDLASGSERVLYRSGAGSVPEGVELGTPNFNERDGLLAATVRGRQRYTGLFPLQGQLRKVGGGCQLVWAPDYGSLVFVDHGGRQKNAFYRYEVRSGKISLILDLEGDYSHEYFPKYSNDGSLLVFAASAGEHEHDQADYEIFLWPLGKAPSEAVRVSPHVGNDNWPDVYILGAVPPPPS